MQCLSFCNEVCIYSYVYNCKLSTSESCGVNRHTAWFTVARRYPWRYPPPKIIPPSRIVSVVQVSASFHKILRLVSRLESVRIPLLCQLGSGGRGIVPVFIFCRGNLQGEHFPGDYVMNADTQAPYPLSLSISWCLMKSRSAPPRAPIWL